MDEAVAALGENKANTVTIAGQKLCLAVINQRLVAVSDSCTHNGESLGKGKINFAGEVVCPWHGYRFELKTGRCRSDSPDLETFPIKIEEDGVFLGI